MTDAGAARGRDTINRLESNFPVMESRRCSGMALQAGRRELSRVDLSGMFTHSPKLMECQSKGKRNGGKGATSGLGVGGRGVGVVVGGRPQI